jgi:hypothetical protein
MKKLSFLLFLLFPFVGWGAAAAPEGTLTADGSYEISFKPGERGTIAFSGDFGSGTITVLYLIGDTYVAFKDTSEAISYTDDDGFEFTNPSEGTNGRGAAAIRVTLTGSTSADIDYKVAVVKY